MVDARGWVSGLARNSSSRLVCSRDKMCRGRGEERGIPGRTCTQPSPRAAQASVPPFPPPHPHPQPSIDSSAGWYLTVFLQRRKASCTQLGVQGLRGHSALSWAHHSPGSERGRQATGPCRGRGWTDAPARRHMGLLPRISLVCRQQGPLREKQCTPTAALQAASRA